MVEGNKKSKKTIFVEVYGGNVTELHNVPKGYEWELIDWDNLLNEDFYTRGDAEREWKALTPEAKAFVRTHYTDDWKKIMKRIREDKD